MAAVQDFAATLARLRSSAAGAQANARVRVELIEDGEPATARDLGEGVYRIGARSDCDLIIPEASAPHIATLKIAKDAGGQWQVSLVPFTTEMRLNGKPLASFNPVTIREAAIVSAGATTLRFTPLGIAGALSGMARAASQKMAAASEAGAIGSLRSMAPKQGGPGLLSSLSGSKFLSLAALLFAAAVASSFWDAFSGSRPFGGSAEGAANEPRIEQPNDVIRLVRQQLAAADLSDHIRARLEAGIVVLEGAVSERQEDRYRGLLPALRRRSAVEIRSNVRPVAMPMQSQIAGVALEPTPMLVMLGGERYQVGDMLPEEWRVESITSQGVTISRGTLRETIALGGGR